MSSPRPASVSGTWGASLLIVFIATGLLRPWVGAVLNWSGLIVQACSTRAPRVASAVLRLAQWQHFAVFALSRYKFRFGIIRLMFKLLLVLCPFETAGELGDQIEIARK